MLERYKSTCKEYANRVEGWESLDKNELCRLCIKHEDDEELYNAYFAAVLYNYCGTIGKYFQSCGGLVTVEQCADWVEDAIIYALKHRKWEDPSSSIYNDPNGPDKVINRIMKCTRANLYQYTNRKKRKDSFNMKSLDAITEAVHDNSMELIDREDHLGKLNLDIKAYIKESFDEKDYFRAYMIDCIINDNVFNYIKETGTYEFDTKKLSRRICAINEDYCKRFAREYDIPEEQVIKTLIYFRNINSNKLLYKIDTYIKRLKHDKYFSTFVRGK